jgi:hypothetical protein
MLEVGCVHNRGLLGSWWTQVRQGAAHTDPGSVQRRGGWEGAKGLECSQQARAVSNSISASFRADIVTSFYPHIVPLKEVGPGSTFSWSTLRFILSRLYPSLSRNDNKAFKFLFFQCHPLLFHCLCLPSKCSTTELHPQPLTVFLREKACDSQENHFHLP